MSSWAKFKEDTFRSAAMRLLNIPADRSWELSGHAVHQICTRVAESAFTSTLQSYPGSESDLDLIRTVATRLWSGDGTTGLS